MEESMLEHQPVLLDEVITHLAIKEDGVYVDATFGRGGHSRVILNKLGLQGRLFIMDKDPLAIAYAEQHFKNDSRVTIQQSSFAELEKFLTQCNHFGKVDGILLDLGVSSPQLDDPERGFSFLRAGNLDMRMDTSQGIDATTWLSNISEQMLAKVLWEYGEERYSRRIAHAIVMARHQNPITTTTQLAEIIAEAHPSWQKGKHPATQSFQAIRIAINHELEDLEKGLKQSLAVLKKGGRLLVISFHSLEDRIVKHFIQQHAHGDSFPAGLPIKQKYLRPQMRRIGRAIKPTPQEVVMNPRSRSAVLRIAEKLL